MYFMLTNNSENIEAEAICTSTIAYLLVAPHGFPFILDLRSIWQHLLENGWGKNRFVSTLAYLTLYLE